MGNREQIGSQGQSDWPVRIAGAVGAGGALGLALFLGPMVGIAGFWQGLIAVIVAITIGGILGRLVGVLLFRRSSAGPPDSTPAK